MKSFQIRQKEELTIKRDRLRNIKDSLRKICSETITRQMVGSDSKGIKVKIWEALKIYSMTFSERLSAGRDKNQEKELLPKGKT